MRALIQKVRFAHIADAEDPAAPYSQIGSGLCVFLGICCGDTEADARYIADKTASLRIFEDENGRLNRSVCDTGGSILLVSQFTLCGDARKGRRPSFGNAAPPEQAEPYYRQTAQFLRGHGLTVAEGRFRTHMLVSLCNDGPVTLLLDSRKQF